MSYELRYVPGPLPDRLEVELAEGEADSFGVRGLGLTFAPKEHFAVAYDGELPLAIAGWLPRDVRSADRAVAAAGLGSVLVRASYRGRGLCRLVVAEAMRTAAAAGRTHGILFCKPRLESLYAHLGWVTIKDEVTFVDPAGDRQRSPFAAMVHPLVGEPWPVGEVDVNGPLF